MQIKEVSKKYSMSPDTLRYYEKIGLIPPVNRTSGGVRDFTEDNLKWVYFVKCMRGAGLPIESLTRYLELFHQGDKTIPDRVQILKDEKEKLELKRVEIETTIATLNHKIENYHERLNVREKELDMYPEEVEST